MIFNYEIQVQGHYDEDGEQIYSSEFNITELDMREKVIRGNFVGYPTLQVISFHDVPYDLKSLDLTGITVIENDDAELDEAKSRKMNDFKYFLYEKLGSVYSTTINGKEINTKVDDETKTQIQDLKSTLDDYAFANSLDDATKAQITTNLWFNATGENVVITYVELIQIRLFIADILGDLFTKKRTIPVQISNATTIDEVNLISF